MIDDIRQDGKYLGTISSDFVKVSESIKFSSIEVRRKGFLYPIFPLCKTSPPLGVPLIKKGEMGNVWHYHASFLKEFVSLELINQDKQDFFKKIYKDPDEFCCLFVLDKDFTQFVYIPYPVD